MQHFAGIPRAAWCPFAGDPGQVRGLEPAATLAYAVQEGGVITGMNERIDVIGVRSS